MGNSREVHCRGFGVVLNNSIITQKKILLCRDSSIYLLIDLLNSSINFRVRISCRLSNDLLHVF